MKRFVLVTALAAGVLTLLGGSALAVPGTMTWTDTGTSGGSTGTFTAAAPLCPAGTFRDIAASIGIKIEYTCADGSGKFEFEVVGGGGWSFTAGGTGAYTTLRGKGSCSVTQNDDGTFTRPCHALADFDATAPTARIKPLDVLLARHRFNLQASFATTDNVAGNAVKYRVSVAAAGKTLGHKTGATPGGTVRVAMGGRLPKRAHRLTFSVRVVDPLGNARTITRSARIPR